MSERVVLKIEGVEFEGWEAVAIRRSLNALASSFELSLSDVAQGALPRRVIDDQAACEVWLGSDLVITGRIFDLDRETSVDGRTLSVAGRDSTADIIDCSAVHKPGSWTGQKLDRIGRDLLSPFGLTLKVEAPIGDAFAKFALEPGETVFDALTRMARMRGVMLKSDRAGNVVVFKPATASSGRVLKVGTNMRALRTRSTSDKRFSQYIVKGQHHGGRDTTPKDATGPRGQATDPGVTRYRPLVIISDEQATPAGLAARARWEASARLGEALQAEGLVAGWRFDDGALIEPDIIVRVICEADGVDEDLMIADVDFDQSDSTTTRLGFARPQAWTAEPLAEAKKGRA